MSTTKNLRKLLDFIAELAIQQGNEWFKEELLVRLLQLDKRSESVTTGISELQENVELIRKYLTLDVIPLIDYSGIENEAVRNQLFRDSIEMAKYRLGKINDTVSFDEFCRYAHLQAEELINYFYFQKFNSNIENILGFLKAFGNYNPSNRLPENLNHIDYGFKLKSFVSYIGLDNKIKNNLEYINSIRNEISHRNSLQKVKDDEVLIEFERLGFSINKFVDLTKYSNDQKKIFYSGKYIIFKRMQDYQGIYEMLNVLKQTIIANLNEDYN